MPVEFALRPRIRLREEPAPARRARPRLPKFALPALAYWLLMGGLVYAFVRQHDASPQPPATETALAQLPIPAPPVVRPWWRPLPAPVESPPASSIPEPPAPAPELEALEALEPPLPEPPPPELETFEPALPERPSATEAPLRTRASAPTPRPVPPAQLRAPAPVHLPGPALPLSPPAADVRVPVEVPALPRPLPSTPPVAGTLPSCEAASASANEDVDFSGGNRTADLPSQAIAAVLENGAWLSSCAVPERTALDVCVAIKGGRVVGASVTSRPHDSALDQCVRRRAAQLQFPYSPHLDLARTRF